MKFAPLFIAQADAAATAPVETTEAQGVPAEGEAAPAKGADLGIMPILLLGFGLMYFMMIRPQQRKEKERQKMVSELRAGKRVSFAGGLIGTITEAKEKTFIIEIAPQTRIEVARGAVAGPVDEPTPEEPKKR